MTTLETLKAPGFRITDHKGFQMTFANGYTVSVQFGPGSYCDKQNVRSYRLPASLDEWSSKTAEIAAWGPDGVWYSPEGWDDDVKGWVNTNDVADFIAAIAKLETAVS